MQTIINLIIAGVILSVLLTIGSFVITAVFMVFSGVAIGLGALIKGAVNMLKKGW